MAYHARRVICASVAGAAPATDAPRGPGRPPAFLPLDLEPVLPAQWFQGDHATLQPAKRLMLAILTDALELALQDPAPEATRRAFWQRRAADWIRSDDAQWFYSFRNVCETLGIDAKRLRAGVNRIVDERGANR